MQLARMFWLDQDKRWKRKLAEMIITLQLEQSFPRRRSSRTTPTRSISAGAARSTSAASDRRRRSILGKDLSQINLPEAAQLAGLIQRPGYLRPVPPSRPRQERRNIVLRLMRENGYITDRDYALAIEAPIVVPKGGVAVAGSAVFRRHGERHAAEQVPGHDFQSTAFRVYTTLDMRLQRAAARGGPHRHGAGG